MEGRNSNPRYATLLAFNKKNTIILKRKIVNNKCIITYNKVSINDYQLIII